jgi:BirA family biotin operon repressor/biotin-[acetyl-CoA-carboxylase] ligase
MRIIHLDSVDSTNAYAKTLINKVETPVVIVADEQTAGRGRYDRVWQAGRGNLMMSLLLDADKHVEQLGQLSFVASLALAQVIDDDAVTLKWPNDVMFGGKKMAGILIEALESGGDVSHVIIGVGVNISSHPEDALFSATSLNTEHIVRDRDELMNSYIECFGVLYKEWLTDFSSIRSAWLAKCGHIGDKIVVKSASTQKEGVFMGLGLDGELLLQLSDGKQEAINTGDVFFKDDC